jgi:exopolysaccharide/PEP-CTERM locus tyrosine autokinase
MTEQTPTDRPAGKSADRLWLIERAAERLDAARADGQMAGKPAATGPTANGAASVKRSLAERAEAAAQRTQAAQRQQAAKPQPGPAADPVDGPSREAGRTAAGEPAGTATPPSVQLDLKRLQHEGYLTPATMTSALAEEMRLVKRSVLHQYRRAARPHANVILVTSSRPGEGKSFLSINLAMSLACEYDLRVVLVDGDFARPDLMERLGVGERDGLLDVTADSRRDLSEVLLRTDIDSLSLIPSGKSRELASELVGSARMGQLVDELASRYPDRLVIIDSAPLLGDSGAAILSEHVGQIVFVVESDNTDRDTIDAALEMIPAEQEPQIVLNKNRGRGQARTPYYKYAGR